MSRPRATINPDVLRWARENAGYSIDEAAVKPKVPPSGMPHGKRLRRRKKRIPMTYNMNSASDITAPIGFSPTSCPSFANMGCISRHESRIRMQRQGMKCRVIG